MPGQLFRRYLIVAKDVVKVPVVKRVVDIFLQRRQFHVITNETVLVKSLGCQFDDHDVIMPVQTCALVVVGQTHKPVRCREVEFFGDTVHQASTPFDAFAIAAFQKSESSYSVGSAIPAR